MRTFPFTLDVGGGLSADPEHSGLAHFDAPPDPDMPDILMVHLL